MARLISGEEKNYNIPNESLGKYFLNCLKNRDPNDVVCIDGSTGEELTCRKLLENGIKFTQILKDLGLKQGDVLVVVNENDLNYYTILFGALCNGVVVNPLNPGYLFGELAHAFNLSQPKLVISSKTSLKNVQSVVQELEYIPEIILFEEDVDNTNLKNLESLLNEINLDLDHFEFKPDEFDVNKQGAIILLSSGTTGLPKAVLLTHLNLINIIGYFGDANYFDTAFKTTVQVVPNYHVFGLLLQFNSITISLKIILLKKFVPELFLSCLEKYEANILYAVPSILLFMVKSQLVSKYNLSKIKAVVVGAAPVGNDLKNEAKLKFQDVTIKEVYGATEVGGACTLHTSKRNKPGSCGQLLPGIIGKVVDIDTKKPVGPGELGELCFKGAQVMKEYVRNVQETRDSFDEDGFYRTGDLGYCDEDGFFFIVDRLKELIKYKGYQVPPAELETLLITHPGIKDCGVVGKVDERAGQVAVAFVVKQPNSNITEEEIINFVAERISVQKRLYGGVRFIEEIPRNPGGKILRRELVKIV